MNADVMIEDEYRLSDLTLDVAKILPSKKEISVTPSKELQVFTADGENEAITKVEVDAIDDAYIIPEGKIDITENGSYDVTNVKNADVNVQLQLQEKTTTENGEVLPDEGFDGLSKVNVKVPIPTDGEYYVKVIDYDGTIIKETRLNDGETYTLPTPPTHERLIFQEWSSTEEIVDNMVTVNGNNILIGPLYTTKSGLTEFDIEITKDMVDDIETNGFTITLNGNGNKWWDYSNDTETSDTSTKHTYYAYGKYTIATDQKYVGTISNVWFETKSGTSIPAKKYLKHARIANIVQFTNYMFSNCVALETISLPNTITNSGECTFQYCYRLKCVILPKKIGGTLYKDFCSQCYSLETLVVPNGINYLRNYVVYDCRCLKNFVFPKSIKGVDSNFRYSDSLTEIVIPDGMSSSPSFSDCFALRSIKFGDSVTTIGAMASTYTIKGTIVFPKSLTTIQSSYPFRYLFGVGIFDFSKCLQVPTLPSGAFPSTATASYKIVVPDALYDEWIVATNWATYAKLIYKASEVQ